MKIKDIHVDLDSEIQPFPESLKKEIFAGELGENNTSDISIIKDKTINLSKGKFIKISKNSTKNLFKKILSFDSIKKVRKQKTIDISQPDINPTEVISESIKKSGESIKLNAGEFYDNNIKKKNHNFKYKKIRNTFYDNKNKFHLGYFFNKNKVNNSDYSSFQGVNIVKKYQSFGLFNKIVFGSIFLSLFLFGLKFSIQYSVNSGYKNLASIKDGDISFNKIQKTINDARFSFVLADILFTPISFIDNQNIQNGYNVIQGGKQITLLGDEFLQFFDGIQKLIQKKGIDNIYISQVLRNSKDKFLNFELYLSRTLIYYDKISQIGDIKLQNTFDNTVKKLHKALGYIKTINLNFDEFLAIMGDNDQRKYLIVFQNNDEIRPTGGFMGSMGIITIYKGKVVSIEKSDVYKYEWEINKYYKNNNIKKEKAPKGLDKLTGTWGLRDSNYRPFIKDTAEDIKGFLEKINVGVDGIIFINKSTIEEILKVSGGIEFDNLGMKITDENFSRVISTLVEAKTSKVGTLGTPKQILFDFAEQFYKKMKENKDYIPYAKVIFNNLLNREIIIYSFHPEENSLLWKLNLNGELSFNKTLDFAYPVYTSLSGNKSDRYIETSYNKTVNEIGKCNYKTNLEIIRRHTYNNLEEEKIDVLLNKYNITDRFQIKKIQGKADNSQYMRIYLPKNAEIKLQKGMTIQTFDRYKLLDFYMKTRLYETTSYNIEYNIAKLNCKGYSYKLYKQPGIPKYNMAITINGEEIFARDVKKDFVIKR